MEIAIRGSTYMTKILIILGLIITPFLISPFSLMPILPMIDNGTRPPKELISLLFALAIFLSALFNGEIKSFTNKWYLIFLFYIPFAIWHSPPFITLLGQHNIAGTWQWQPFCYILIYMLLIVSVSSLRFSRHEIHKMFSIITVVGVIMAFYVIVQSLNIEQFFTVKPVEIGSPMKPKLMGSLGNSTIVSAFLVMCLPFCYYMRKWFRALILIIAVLLCNSQMATGTMIVCFVLYLFIYAPMSRPYLGTFCLCAAIGLTLFGITQPKEFRSRVGDNSRFVMWHKTVKDINSPPINQAITPNMNEQQKQYLTIQNDRTYPFTGLGLGSFKIMYSEKHKTFHPDFKRWVYPKWGSPHNFYIHIAYCLGIVGLGLFLIVLWTTLWPALLKIRDAPDILPVFISVISVLILSIATFILEIEPHRIYSAIFIGLLLNNSITNEKKQGIFPIQSFDV